MSATEIAVPGTVVPIGALMSPGGGQGVQGIQGIQGPLPPLADQTQNGLLRQLSGNTTDFLDGTNHFQPLTNIPAVTATAKGLVPSPASLAMQGLRTNSSGTPGWDALEFTNVVLFGADPTGSADSTTAIQNAINSLPSAGGTVFFPAGLYKVSSTITLSKSGSYIGAGNYSTYIQTSSAAADIFNITASGVDLIGFNFAASVTRTGGYYINAAANVFDVRIREFVMMAPYFGIHCTWPRGEIRNGYFSNTVAANGVMIMVDGGGPLIEYVISNSTVAQPKAGIQINNTPQIQISHCSLIQAGVAVFLACAVASTTIDCIYIDNSIFDTCSYGLYLQSSTSTSPITRVTVSSCWFATCTNAIITQTLSGGSIDGLLILGCKVLHCSGNGIVIGDAGAINVQIRDCGIVNNGTGGASHGIGVLSGVSQFSITGCRIGNGFGLAGNTGYGIYLAASNTNFIITNNDLRGNTLGEQGGTGTGVFVNTNNI